MSIIENFPELSAGKMLITLLAVLLVMGIDVSSRLKHRNYHYAFGVIMGTLLSAGLLKFTGDILRPGATATPAMMGIGVLLVMILWRLLFGSWETHVKATVLGSFIVWVGLRILWGESEPERLAHLLALMVAVIPAMLWGLLFLKYHRERLSTVFLLFFGGIVSTAPILFYDALLTDHVELQFFFFRVVPENFYDTVADFLHSRVSWLPDSIPFTTLSLFMTFILVALLEEFSKFWVLKNAGRYLYSSIDDVMQMGVLVAIGFAFAENILNQGYFLGFIQNYLTEPTMVDWSGFTGNIAGRSVLTSMVHIVSTGVMGYFYGLVVFAGPYLQEGNVRGPMLWFIRFLTRLFGIPQKSVFRGIMLLLGLAIATVLHATSNFLVTLPEVLPGNPYTVGQLLGAAPESPLQYVALLLLPSVLYVGGGFWLLTYLFTRRTNMKERGHVFTTDTFVTRTAEE